MNENELPLRYGCNPHQSPAMASLPSGRLPIHVLNGTPSYINLLDGLNSWQLVRELRQSLDLPAAASFKHVSPAGAAVGVPLSESLARAYFAEDLDLSPLATAYVRARGADRLSSYGDWVALSDPVDVETAEVIRREVSDGVIAPGYAPEALAVLRKKKKGAYLIMEIDAGYEPPQREIRQVFGITLEQPRNARIPMADILREVVTEKREIPDWARRDLLVATIALKYTQSNSVCLAYDGQVIGLGAGQQSRVHCTRLAAGKADLWFLRQHPTVLDLRFKPNLGRPARDNAIDAFLRDEMSPAERHVWESAFGEVPAALSLVEKRRWLDQWQGVSLSSDGHIPFRDNIDRAAQSGVGYVVEPGGSLRDDEVILACNEYGMVLAFSHLRLFHH